MPFAQSGPVVWGNATSRTFAFAAAPAQGDYLLLVAVFDGVGRTFTWPPGFTQGDFLEATYDGQDFAWAWKIAGASETNSYEVIVSGAACHSRNPSGLRLSERFHDGYR